MGLGGTKGKLSNIESAVEVRFVIAKLCKELGREGGPAPIKSSKERGTAWLGGVSWPAVRKSIARGVPVGVDVFDPARERPVIVGE